MTQTAQSVPTATLRPAPSVAAAATPRAVVIKHVYANAAEWLQALGEVPLKRIVMTPWPGTATEQDLIVFAERDGRFCELIDGTLVEKAMGSFESLIAARLITALNVFVQP